MLKTTLISIVLAISCNASAVELPPLAYFNEDSVLDHFPLNVATKEDVFSQYGPPTSNITGLPMNSETWTYEKDPKSKYYVIVFRGDIVYDVIVKFHVDFFNPKSARKAQSKK